MRRLWDLSGEAAIRNEVQRGLDSIASSETAEGSARFTNGAGWHGSFS
jgi:hypothetical protein